MFDLSISPTLPYTGECDEGAARERGQAFSGGVLGQKGGPKRGIFGHYKFSLLFFPALHGDGYMPDTLSRKGSLPDALAIPEQTWG